MKKILVVDDDRMTVELITTYLKHERYTVLTALDGRSALELAQEQQPDLIILDLMLPHIDGLDVARVLRTQSNVPIIMLTARSTEEDVLIGLGVGADDYITKPFSPRELVARVRTVLRRVTPEEREEEPSELIFGDLRINLPSHQVFIGDEFINLTPREFKLLTIMANTPGRVFSRTELLERTSDPENLERAIDFHIMNLRKKLEKYETKRNTIETVFGVGYRFNA